MMQKNDAGAEKKGVCRAYVCVGVCRCVCACVGVGVCVCACACVLFVRSF